VPVERRRELRRRLRVEVDLETVDGLDFVGHTLDMSPSGLCIEAGAPLKEGDRVLVHLRIPGAGRPLCVQARVVWSRDLANGLQVAGLRVVGMAPEDAAVLRQYLQEDVA